VGVIGLGIGRHHALNYARLLGVELAGVCDLNAELAAQVAAEHGCRAYDDPRRLLAEAEPHAVSICTPPKTHRPLAEAAAARGVHVLVEKPLASTVEDCDRLTAACADRGVLLMVGHKKRFSPPLVRLRELASGEGQLGAIRQVVVRYMHPGLARQGWFWDEHDGGGPILENHVHAADTLCYLLGTPQRVFAEGTTRFLEPEASTLPAAALEVPNVATYTARFGGLGAGQDALVSVGYGMIGPMPSVPFGEEHWFFVCERGQAEVTGRFDRLALLRWAERQRTAEVHEEAWPAETVDTFPAELAHFVECVRTGAPPRIGGGAGREAVRFCLAVLESARTGMPVLLEPGAQPGGRLTCAGVGARSRRGAAPPHTRPGWCAPGGPSGKRGRRRSSGDSAGATARRADRGEKPGGGGTLAGSGAALRLPNGAAVAQPDG
jgi:predicted dehydrogenase